MITNRIDFEDFNYGLNLSRKGDGYLSEVVQARYEGWKDAIENQKRTRRYRLKRNLFITAKALMILVIALLILLEVYVLLHFALKFW